MHVFTLLGSAALACLSVSVSVSLSVYLRKLAWKIFSRRKKVRMDEREFGVPDFFRYYCSIVCLRVDANL